MLGHLHVGDWLLLVVAAAVLGLAKTLLSGLGPMAVAIFALVIPARESTGAILPLLLFGDALAVLAYRRHGDARQAGRLLVGVLPGFVAGAIFLSMVGDRTLRYAMGALLLTIAGAQLLATRHHDPASADLQPRRSFTSVIAGVPAGFATMIANSGGPFMTWYLLRDRRDVLRVAGTTAFFFAAVNVVKLPISIGLGILTLESFVIAAALALPLAMGATGGLCLARSMGHRSFEGAAAVVAAMAGVALIA